MPALSSTMKEGKVVSWLKSEGDQIVAGEAIMVVESDKADMDVEAFEDGFLAAILTGEGESGAVGAPVALIATEEKDISALKSYAATLSGRPASLSIAQAPTANPAVKPVVVAVAAAAVGSNVDRVVASPLARKKAEQLGVDLTNVAGTGPNGRVTAGDVELFAAGKTPAATKSTEKSVVTNSWVPANGVIAATPTARALAKKAKLDVNSIKGTGEFGRVTADDVKIATGEKKPDRKQVSGAKAKESIELPNGPVPMTGMQRCRHRNFVLVVTSKWIDLTISTSA
jgi:pyruvate dehydrogenase E2 component (dihydrolipoamide acetyltransferase)